MIFEHVFIGLPSNGYENSSFSGVSCKKIGQKLAKFFKFYFETWLDNENCTDFNLDNFSFVCTNRDNKKAEELECIYQMI
jgi:hypothetical protein